MKKIKNVMNYTDDEINSLSFCLALKLDKRTFCEYYISLLKTKHILINSFIYNKDYNSKIIKIDLFFIEFTIFYTINALFFTDETMHKIYKGDFNFLYQFSVTIYSSLISIVLTKPLEILALSNDEISDFKINNNFVNIIKRKDLLNKNLIIKFVLYFTLSFIFLIFFWYYISMFCAVYNKTQLHLIKDTLISFGLSLIYPFCFCLLPGIFRIPALYNKNKKRQYLYNFSKILQTILLY